MILPTVRELDLPEINKKEVMRYAGCKGLDGDVLSLVDSCIAELDKGLKCRVCFIEAPVEINGETVGTELFEIHSRDLAKNLFGCSSVIVFAASIGIEIDRFIKKYSLIMPSRALVFQAIGTERIEALCDAFCFELSKDKQLKPRFSPGYGDLDLRVQKDIFEFLDCSKRMGLSLNNSLLMTPSKSVTAFVGVIK